MGFRFRKSMKVGGVRLNFTHNGLTSVSAGGKRGRVTVGKRGTRVTTNLGGGLSHSQHIPHQTVNRSNQRSLLSNKWLWLILALFFIIIPMIGGLFR